MHEQRLPRRPCAAASLALVFVLSSCSASPSTTAVPESDGISVSIYQPRPDVAAGRIAIQVHNDSSDELVVEAAELTSSYYTTDLVWDAGRVSTIAAGRAVDLRVPLGDADCGPVEPEHTVTLTYTLAGATRTAEFTPTIDFDILDQLHVAACLEVRVAEVAALTSQSLATSGGVGAPGVLTVAVEPTGAEGSVTIDAAFGTTLLSPALDGAAVPELELGVAIDRDGPPVVEIPLVPNRCDPHALAEDKVGTRIPLTVTAPDGTSGRLVLAASDELRQELYAFYSGYCGLG